MRIVLASLVTVAAVVVSQPALAAPAPWCAKLSLGEDYIAERCEYKTFEACLQVIVGQGPSFCVQNPAYNPNAAPEPRARRKAQPQTR